MDIVDYIKYAQLGQIRLKQLNLAAEHIYLAKNGKFTAIVFISEKYSNFDLYSRTKLASQIRNGPLTLDFYLLSSEQLLKNNSTITRELIYNSNKIFGTKPLIFGDSEYASPKDVEYKNNRIYRSATS